MSNVSHKSFNDSSTLAVPATMVDHALYYAAAGLAVFPAPIGTKKSHKAAKFSNGEPWGMTKDSDEIRRNFNKWPDANIGIPTGPENGFFVVEADTIEGHDVDGLASLAALEATHGPLPATRESESPSGSVHRHFKHPGFFIKSSASVLGPGIDVKGDGGMVIVPPSVVHAREATADKPAKSDGVYKWRNDSPLADAPQWLLDLIVAGKKKPERVERTAAAVTVSPLPDIATHVEKVSHREYHKVAQAPAGQRNHQLNVSSMMLGKFVGSGELDEQKAIQTMLDACKVNGLLDDGEDSCVATIESGLKKGKTEPNRTAAEMFKGAAARIAQLPADAGAELPPPPTPEEMAAQANFAEDMGAGRIPGPSGDEEEGFTQLNLDDFLAYLPLNQYIYLPTRALWPTTTLNTTLAPVEVGTTQVKDPVSGQIKEVPLKIRASTWLNKNRGVACMTWAPGYEMVIHGMTIQRDGWVNNPGKTTFNEYREPTIERVPGDPSPWVNHIRLLCGEHAQHVLYYFAHRVQKPAEKINHALVFGGSQGIGKDTAFEPLKAAVGPWNFKEASPVTMMGQFDPYKKCVVLRVNEARDLGDMTRHEFYERIKNLSAAPPDVLPVNEKYLGETYIPNVCGVLVTTNHQDAIALPADDRRCFVMWSTLTKEDFTEKYWIDLYAWYASGGNEIVAHYLANMDLSGFNPKAYPPRTEAWHQMVGFSAAPEDAELADAIEALKKPDALTVGSVIAKAAPALMDYLRERRNSRSIPVRFNKCGYVPVRNKDAKDGLWVVGKKRQVVYAKAALSERDRTIAATRLALPPLPF
jgi:hypothetical protein